MMESQAIIGRLYRENIENKATKEKKRKRARRKVSLLLKKFRARRATWIVVLSTVFIIMVWSSVHVYYYNTLINLRYNVSEAWAQVEAQKQKRAHIQRNLLTITKNYAQHERDVLTSLTEIRSARPSLRIGEDGTGAAGSGREPSPFVLNSETDSVATPFKGVEQGQLSQNIPQVPISITAEQYPQLMLSGNLQQFSKAIIATETEITNRTIAYNEAVNTYSTEINQFPGSIFAQICGFEGVEFYLPERNALAFNQVEY